MKNERRALLCLSVIVLITVLLALAPYAEAERALSGKLNARNPNLTARGVVNVTGPPSPLDDGMASSLRDMPTTNASSFPVHNTNTSEKFSAIQNAIDAPNTTDGHILKVDPGVYAENVKVNKSLTIISTSEDPITTIVQTPNASVDVFTVTADHVGISGFTIEGALGYDNAGIYLASDNNSIANNILTSNYYGILSANVSGNSTIADNNANLNVIGIALIDSSGNTIRNNLVESNSDFGIYLESSNNNVVTNNNASFNQNLSWSGIRLWDSSDNKITNNIAHSNGILSNGIELLGITRCNNNLIDNNSAKSNGGSGIILWEDFNDNNIITNNTACYNEFGGIELYGGCNNIIRDNSAHSNKGSGISLFYWTKNNTLENNTVSYNEFSGIDLIYYTTNNSIKNNSASYNNVCGIALFHSSSSNIVAHNELSSNKFGLSIVQLGGTASNNQLINNTICSSETHGIHLLDLTYANTVTNNTVSNSTVFGILVENSSKSTIRANMVKFNQRGIGLDEACDMQVTDNIANFNEISGISLINSTNNTLVQNAAGFNTYEGVYLSNSHANNISNNDIAESYFGISLYASNSNTLVNNTAESIYYYKVFNYSSTGIVGIAPEDIYNQTEIVHGVRVSIPEALTPSLQFVDSGVNVTYLVIAENLGNMPDTFTVNVTSGDDPAVLVWDRDSVTLGPSAISADTTLQKKGIRVKMDVATIKLNVGDPEPGVYRATITAAAERDPTVKDSIETWTIVQGEINSKVSADSTVIDSALVDSHITARSSIDTSAILNSTISSSTITASIIKNSEVIGTFLNDVIVEDARITNGIIAMGSITINEVTYEIERAQRIADLVIGSDYSDSNLVGIKDGKPLNVTAELSDVNVAITARGDYVAGSMLVQKAVIPPNGIYEDTNTIGGYIYANVSDNVAGSTGWVRIKVFYDPNELGALNEDSLRLRYVNESVDPPRWDDVPVSGLNLEENYVWGNISHYSVFAVSGSVTPKEPSKTGGRGHASIDSDNDGLTDLQELILGTDEHNADTDGDGFEDDEDPFPLDPMLPLQSTTTPAEPHPSPITPAVPPPVTTPEPVPPAVEEGASHFEFPIPGFEAVFALGSVLAATYLILRRRS